jgi:hypothetical protein
MMSARVTRVLGTASEYVEYTMERAGPPLKTIHRSHAVVAVIHGAVAGAPAVR